MQIPEARWIVFGTLILFSVMIALYVSFYFRDLAFGSKDAESDDLLTNFRQMRDDGHLGDEEFSQLKQVIPKSGDTEPATSQHKERVPEQPAKEKKFLTLAEAQQIKNQKSNQQTNETDLNHEDE